MTSIDLERLMAVMQQSFIPEKSSEFSGVFQCLITGENSADWKMTVKDQTCTIEQGMETNPRATLEMSQEDLIELLNGSLDPLKGFFSGRIQLRGDISSVIKLISMFDLSKSKFQ